MRAPVPQDDDFAGIGACRYGGAYSLLAWVSFWLRTGGRPSLLRAIRKQCGPWNEPSKRRKEKLDAIAKKVHRQSQ